MKTSNFRRYTGDKKEYIGKFLQEILIGKNEIGKDDIRILRIRG